MSTKVASTNCRMVGTADAVKVAVGCGPYSWQLIVQHLQLR